MFPPKERGLGHVTTQIFGIRSSISSKVLQLETINLGRGQWRGSASLSPYHASFKHCQMSYSHVSVTS